MKKILSIVLSLSMLVTSVGAFSLTALADETTPQINFEIFNYLNENEFSSRSGREKVSATGGEKIVVTFSVTGISSLDCYQLSGLYDTSKLSAGYFSGDSWVTGDELQDFDTIVAGSDDYTDSAIDDSFSFTRTIEEPYICLVGYSLNGSTPIEQDTKLISVGFRVLSDIDDISSVFTWDENTMVAVTLDEEEYYFGDGLLIGCQHTFVVDTIAPTCTEDGYTCYTCTKCLATTYKSDFVSATGHTFNITKTGDSFHYGCTACGFETTKTKSELTALWSVDYINKAPTYENDSQYLDFNPDNIINAKDYALLIK